MKKREPRWLEVQDVIGFHGLALAQAGGAEGIRDLGLLESALHRPQHLWHYQHPTLYELAAAYAFGIVNNHPFVDGNKRAALLAAFTFLVDNGIEPPADQAQAVVMTLGLADKTISQARYAAWLSENDAPE